MISTKTGASISMINTYIKDLSFENPKAPLVYSNNAKSPKIETSININAVVLQKDIYEIELVICIKAHDDKGIVFILELSHAGIFEIKNISESLLDETLFVDCPYLLFPFSRSIISNIVVNANFPSLVLDYIDFDELYKNRDQDNK